MGLWDKSKLLDGNRLDEAFQAGEAFILYGMKVAGEIDLGNNLPPATKTVLLTEGVKSTGGGTWAREDEPEVSVVGTLSNPIAQMGADASDSDFPVIVSWAVVHTKNDRDATVLNYHGDWEGGMPEPEEIPADWFRF